MLYFLEEEKHSTTIELLTSKVNQYQYWLEGGLDRSTSVEGGREMASERLALWIDLSVHIPSLI